MTRSSGPPITSGGSPPGQSAAFPQTVGVPPSAPHWIRRQRLEHRLDQAVRHDVVLVTAPAGFGKTTALVQWVSARAARWPICWLTVADSHNDPRRFVNDLTAAIAAAGHRDGSAPHRDELARTPAADADVVGRLLVDLERRAGYALLVLSQVERITSTDSLAILDALVANLSFGVHVVLDTRRRPDLSLARIRAAGRLDEIGPDALRFDRSETAALLEHVHGAGVDDDAVRTVAHHTGGWPAALFLTSRAIASGASPPSRAYPVHPDVVDFVAAEVFDVYDDEDRQLLLRLSLFDECAADLAEVVGDDTTPARFAALCRSDPVLEPVDAGRGRYRMDPVVRAVGRIVLERQQPGIVQQLGARMVVARSPGVPADVAVQRAIELGDAGQIRRSVCEQWAALPLGSALIETALRRLGQAAVRSDPELALVAAWQAGVTNDGQHLSRHLAACDDHPDRSTATFQTVASGAALCRAVFGVGGLHSVRRAAAVALRAERTGDARWYALAAAALAWSHVVAGAPGRALAPLSEAGAPRLSDVDDWSGTIRVIGPAVRAIALTDVGLVDQATIAADEATAAADAANGSPALSAWTLRAVGGVQASRGRLWEARPTLERALRARRSDPWHGNGWPLVELLLTVIPVRWLEGHRARAAAALTEARTLLELHDDAGILPHRLGGLERQLTTWMLSSARTGLTSREVEVLRFIRSGRTRRQLAGELHLSVNTVKSHLRSAYGKLEATSRDDAVARAREVGLL